MIGVVLCGNANFFKFETITFGTIKEIKINVVDVIISRVNFDKEIYPEFISKINTNVI